jgi:hypothetical protein
MRWSSNLVSLAWKTESGAFSASMTFKNSKPFPWIAGRRPPTTGLSHGLPSFRKTFDRG